MGLRVAVDDNNYPVDVFGTTTAPGAAVDVLGDASDPLLAVRESFTVSQDTEMVLEILLSTAGSTVSLVERESAIDGTAKVGTLGTVATGQRGAFLFTARAGHYYNFRLSGATSVVDVLRVFDSRDAALAQTLTGEQIAAAIVANPPTIVVTDPANLELTVTVVPDTATVAQNQYSASVALAFGGTYSLILRDLYLAQYKGAGGGAAILSDLYGDIVIFDSDPSLALASTTLTAAQAAKVVDRIRWANAELLTDTNHGELTARIEKTLASATGCWLAWFHRGATSINSAADDDETIVVRVGAERVT